MTSNTPRSLSSRSSLGLRREITQVMSQPPMQLQTPAGESVTAGGDMKTVFCMFVTEQAEVGCHTATNITTQTNLLTCCNGHVGQDGQHLHQSNNQRVLVFLKVWFSNRKKKQRPVLRDSLCSGVCVRLSSTPAINLFVQSGNHEVRPWSGHESFSS